MAPPTIAITAHEPATMMDPCPVGYSVDFGTFVSGDSSLLDDCVFYWYLTAQSGTSLSSIPDRYRYATDPRDNTITIDRVGASSGTGLTRNIGRSWSMVLPVGDWTINLVCVNPSGETSTVSRNFTVAANTRTNQTLKASGGDHSTWDSAVSWLRNGANRQITVDFDFSGDCNLCNPDEHLAYIVSSDPTNATKPSMSHDPVTGSTNRLVDFTNGDHGMVVDSIQIKPSTVSSGADAVRMRGSNIALINCDILGEPFGSGDYFNSGIKHSSVNGSTDTQLVVGCTIAGAKGSGGYSVHTENTGTNTYTLIHHFGGTYKGSVNESIFRDTSGGGDLGSFTQLAYCFLDNSDVQSKSCARMQFGRYCDMIGLRALDGDISTGVWGTPSSDATGAKNHLIEGCISTGVATGGASIDVKTDSRDVRIRNCFAGSAGISMGDGTADTSDENINVRVYNCATEGQISGPGITTPGAITGAELKQCIANSATTAVSVNSTVFGTGAIDQNSWNSAGNLSLNGSNVTLSAWNADAAVGTDSQHSGLTFSSTGQPSTSVVSGSVLPENPNDMFGNPRAATTQSGPFDEIVEPGSSNGNPLNLNLDRIVLPTREATALTKVLVVHDSQGLRQTNRWVGQTRKWDMQHVGMMVYGINQSGVGPYFFAETSVPGATMTYTALNPGTDWGDGNTSDHAMWSSKISITGTISPNFQPLIRFGVSNSGFTNAYPVDNRHYAKVITRDISGNFTRYRLQEFRGTVRGQADDFGATNDPVEFDFDGSLKVSGWAIRDEASIGNPNDNVGIVVNDSNASDSNRELHVLGALVYSSPANDDYESTGLILGNTGYSGWSCYHHINSQSLQTKEALVEAAQGYDLVIIMLGHNAETSGDFDTNLASLISTWKSAHINKGYSEPDFLLIAPWAATGTSMTSERNDQIRAVASAGGYGFISMWDSYGEANPDGRTERLDGTTVTAYAMDPIHPSDGATAEAIAKDIEWHFDPANHFLSDSPRHPVRFVGGFRRFGVYSSPPSSPSAVDF